MAENVIETDVLIIGAGIAGCRAAIEARDRGASVTLTTKGLFTKDSAATWMSHAGYQVWGIHPDDTLDVHAEDTLRCGWFLNNQENVYAFLAHVPDTAMELLRWGVRYRMKGGKFAPVWQLGCSTKEGRSIYPATYPRGELGFQLSRIFSRVVKTKKINIVEDMFITDLLSARDSIVGAVGIDVRSGDFKVFKAKATILATGGYQGLYKITTANRNLTGDGQAMALRAGVDMMDFEFIQTLPAAVWPPQISGNQLPFLLLIDWDGHMYNSENERFLTKWDPVKMEHSTRAILSRAISHEIREGRSSPHGGVYTSVTHKSRSFIEEKLKEYDRNVAFIKFKQTGIDLSKDRIETGYVVHYCHGGPNVNSKCETDKSGLYAIGEASSGSKDGADRMMSNSLPYCMAMGIIAGSEAAQRAKMVEVPQIDETQVERLIARAIAPLECQKGVEVYQAKSWLQETMGKETGYGRTGQGLKAALSEVIRYNKDLIPKLSVRNKSKRFNFEWISTLEFENLLLVAECVLRNALLRTESRGLHDSWDHMAPSPDWFKNIHLRMINGELKQWTTPVVFTYWKPERGSLGEPWHRGVKAKEYQGWRAEPLYKRM